MTKTPATNPVTVAFTSLDDEEREIYEAIESADHAPINLLTPEKRLEIEAMARAKVSDINPITNKHPMMSEAEEREFIEDLESSPHTLVSVLTPERRHELAAIAYYTIQTQLQKNTEA